MRKRHFADHIAYVQPYKFGGKELDRMYGYDLYDFGARNYDPAIARFTGMDPLSEKYYHLTPYAYCLNNPLKYTDPSGDFYGTIKTLKFDFKYTLVMSVYNIIKRDWGGLQETWRKFDPSAPWSKTNKAWQIDRGLFMTDVSME